MMLSTRFTLLLAISFLISHQCHGKEVGHKIVKRSAVGKLDFSPTRPTSCKKGSTDHVTSLRAQMRKENIDAYIIPMGDAHQSEDIAEEDKRISWVSGFTGSSGLAVVTLDTQESGAVWVDGRYWLQAEQELSCDWLVMKQEREDTPDWWTWLGHLNVSRVGSDPKLTGAVTWLEWEQQLAGHNISLVSILDNLVDKVWDKTDLEQGESKVYVHDVKFTGRSWQDKVRDLREDLDAAGVDAMVVTGLDEIAWLFNIRGTSIPDAPFTKAYAIVFKDKIFLYLSTVSKEIKAFLKTENCNSNCVVIKDYNDIWTDLTDPSTLSSVEKVLLSKPWAYTGGASFAVYESVPEQKRHVALSPIMERKAVKNEVEIKGMESANLKDSVSLITLMVKIEDGLENGEVWDELKVSKELLRAKDQQKNFKGQSFPSISASGPNGAIIHYGPKEGSSRKLSKDEMFLLDSGSQYLEGTTDVTRTFHFGTPTQFEREAYTRVLMGAIDLARAVFKPGTTDSRVDILARTPLYSVGLDYRHGTGHGIGSFGLIHESPVQLRVYQEEEHELKPGMFFSDEPGVYFDNEFGIRLETVLRVVEKNLTYASKGFGPFYAFEPVCLMPFEPKMIDYTLMNKHQLVWLNSYNELVLSKVGKELKRQNKNKEYDWLLKRVRKVDPTNVISGCKLITIDRLSILLSVLLAIVIKW